MMWLLLMSWCLNVFGGGLSLKRKHWLSRKILKDVQFSNHDTHTLMPSTHYTTLNFCRSLCDLYYMTCSGVLKSLWCLHYITLRKLSETGVTHYTSWLSPKDSSVTITLSFFQSSWKTGQRQNQYLGSIFRTCHVWLADQEATYDTVFPLPPNVWKRGPLSESSPWVFSGEG